MPSRGLFGKHIFQSEKYCDAEHQSIGNTGAAKQHSPSKLLMIKVWAILDWYARPIPCKHVVQAVIPFTSRETSERGRRVNSQPRVARY